MKKKSKKPPAKRKPKPDFSQRALSSVEKLIGGKLGDGMKKSRR